MSIQILTPILIINDQNINSNNNKIIFEIEDADFSNFDITTNLLTQGFNLSFSDYNVDPNNPSAQMTNSALSLSSLVINDTNATLTATVDANGKYTFSLSSFLTFPLERQSKLNFKVPSESIDINGIGKLIFNDSSYATFYNALTVAQQQKALKTGNEDLNGIRSLEIRPSSDAPADTLNDAINGYKITYADSTYKSNIIINAKTYLDGADTKTALYTGKAGAVHAERDSMSGASKTAAKVSVRDHFILADVIEPQLNAEVNLIIKGNGDAAVSLENLIYQNGIHTGKETELIGKIKSIKVETTGTSNDIIDVTTSDSIRKASTEHIDVYAGNGDDYILANGLRDIYGETGKDIVVLGSGVQKVHVSSTNFGTIKNDSVSGTADIIYNFKAGEDKLVISSKSALGAANEASVGDITTYWDNATGSTRLVYDSQEDSGLDMEVIIYAYDSSGNAVTFSSTDIEYATN